MEKLYDLSGKFEYENGFYATTDPSRFSKFITYLELFKQTSTVRGEIVEFGIFKGNSFFRWIKFRDLFEQTNSRKGIGFDIFGDFPEAHFEEDKEKRDAFVAETNGGKSISYEEINELLDKQGFNKNDDIIKGGILVTLDNYLAKSPHLKYHYCTSISICTNQSSTFWCNCTIKLPKGIIIFDDYGAFIGANKAVVDFFRNKAEVKKLLYSYAISYIVK